MNCNICQTEMEKGLLKDSFWIPSYKPFIRLGKSYLVIAYKCPQCGKVEPVVENEK